MQVTAPVHDDPPISVRAYARRRKVSHTAVQRAITDGRLVRSVLRAGDGTAQILPALADREWSRSTSPAHSRVADQLAMPQPEVPVASAAPIAPRTTAPVAPDALRTTATATAPPLTTRANVRPEPRPELRGGPDDYRRTLVVEKVVKTKLAQVRLDEQLGRLIDASDAGDAQFEIARLVRNQLQELPDRLAAELALESDAHRVREILAREVDDVLRKLATRLRTFAATASSGALGAASSRATPTPVAAHAP